MKNNKISEALKFEVFWDANIRRMSTLLNNIRKMSTLLKYVKTS